MSLVVIDNGTIVQSPHSYYLWAGHFSTACRDGFIVQYIQKIIPKNCIMVIPACDGDIMKNKTVHSIDWNIIQPYIDKAKEENKVFILGTLAQIKQEPDINYLYIPLDDNFFEYGVISQFKQESLPLWETRSSDLCYRGGCSGMDDDRTSIRIRVVEKIYEYNKNTNVRLIQQWRPPNIPDEYFADKLDYTEFLKYKIFFIIDGNVIASNHMWGFGSGCVPFLISNGTCWFSEYIIPYIHYIPVNYDLSNLIEQIEFIKNNDTIAKQIAMNALEFTKKYFSSEFQKAHVLKNINKFFTDMEIADNYKRLEQYNEAIIYYKKFVSTNIDKNMLYTAYNNMGSCYHSMNKPDEMLESYVEAYKMNPNKLENLYNIISYYRNTNNNTMAYLYYKLTENINDDVIYKWKCYYEYTFFSYYLGIRNIDKMFTYILNNCSDGTVINTILTNLKFYITILKPQYTKDISYKTKYNVNDVEYDFNSSSACIIYNDMKTGYLLNNRLVNYTIHPNGYFIFNNKLVTLNRHLTLDLDLNIINDNIIKTDSMNNYISGVEDIRIFRYNDSIRYIGTAVHKEGNIGIVHGEYNMELKSTEIKPQFNINSTCEKNWVYVNYKGELCVIYKWFPLQICKINNDTNLLELFEEKVSLNIFSQVRGTTCSAVYDNMNWFVLHISTHESMRQYYHMIVIYDMNMELVKYSAPFKLEGDRIEYCMGIIVEETRVIMSYSTNDGTTKLAVYDKNYIDNLLCCYK